MTMTSAINTNAEVSTSAITAAQSKAARRKAFGEVVGNIFYGTLMKQMNASKIKGDYFHGGRGEEAFRGQLSMELAKRMGQSPTNSVVNQMFEAVEKRLPGATSKTIAPIGTDGYAVPKPALFPTEPAPAKQYPAQIRKEYPA